MDAAAIALLAVSMGVLLWRALLRERRDYARFKRLRTTAARQKVLRRWLVENVLVLGGLAAALVFAGAGAIPGFLAAAKAWPLVASGRDLLGGPFGGVIAIAAVVLIVAVLVLPVLLLRGRIDEVPAVGDIRAILPRTRGELPYGAGLAVAAGVFEELLFRLGLPAMVLLVAGDALVAVAASTVVFGLLHLYQGLTGMVLATVLGMVFMLLYLVTGSIAVPILLHVLIDLRSLVLIPIALGGVLGRR